MRIRKVKFQFMWLLMLAVVRFEGILGHSMPVESGVLRGRLDGGRSPSISLSNNLSQVAESFLSHVTLRVTLPTHLGGLERKTIFSCFSSLSTGPPVFFLLL